MFLAKLGIKKDEKNAKMSNFCFIPKINVLMYSLVGVFSACALGLLYHTSVTGAFEY